MNCLCFNALFYPMVLINPSFFSLKVRVLQLYFDSSKIQSHLHPRRDLLFLRVNVIYKFPSLNKYLLQKLRHSLLWNRLSQVFHYFKVEVNVVNRQQVTEIVVLLNHVQIRSCVILACLALAILVQRPKVLRIFFFLHLYLSKRCERRSKPRRSCREYAVKHVNPLNCS